MAAQAGLLLLVVQAQAGLLLTELKQLSKNKNPRKSQK